MLVCPLPSSQSSIPRTPRASASMIFRRPAPSGGPGPRADRDRSSRQKLNRFNSRKTSTQMHNLRKHELSFSRSVHPDENEASARPETNPTRPDRRCFERDNAPKSPILQRCFPRILTCSNSARPQSRRERTPAGPFLRNEANTRLKPDQTRRSSNQGCERRFDFGHKILPNKDKDNFPRLRRPRDFVLR